MSEFKSPLALSGVSRFGALAFGAPALPPALQALRNTLQTQLDTSLVGLPLPMREEAQGMIAAYSGSSQQFFGLFFQPVWSFLHWVVANARQPVAQSMVDNAIAAQALALFLHLWDDHLCDGQLQTTQLTLQVRTDAWSAYLAAAGRLAQQAGGSQADIDWHVSTYLSAIHVPRPVDNLDAFFIRFEEQIAIWTLVPRLIGRAVKDAQTGEDLAAVLRAFCNAWRLMDDLQDIEDDVQAGVESAVWQVLDAPGRSAWSACHVQSKALGHLHGPTWELLLQHLDNSGGVARLLVLIYGWLESAASLAQANSWHALAEEIRAHRPFAIDD